MELKLDISRTYAIALEGGGAKGGYEIGVWRALEEAGVRYNAVSGTSVGALNGALILAESCRAPKRRLPAAVQIGCTFVVMSLTRVLFRAESVGAALAVWRGLFAFRAGAGVLACGLDAADFAAALAAASGKERGIVKIG